MAITSPSSRISLQAQIAKFDELPAQTDIRNQLLAVLAQNPIGVQKEIIVSLLRKHQHPGVKEWLEKALSRVVQPEDAVSLWLKYFDQRPTQMDNRSGLVSSLQMLPASRRLTLLADLIHRHPKSRDLYKLRGRTEAEMGEFDKAESTFTSILEGSQGTQELTQIHRCISQIHEATGNVAKVLESQLQILWIDPQEGDHVAISRAYLRLGQLEKALYIYKDTKSCHILAEIIPFLYKEDAFVAAGAWEALFTCTPVFSVNWSLLCQGLAGTDRPDIAISVWTNIILKDNHAHGSGPPMLESICTQLKIALDARKDPRLSSKTYKDLWIRGPTTIRPRFFDAIIHELSIIKCSDDNRDLHTFAVSLWREMLVFQPDCQEVQDRLRVLLDAGDDAEAVAVWTDLSSQHPALQ